jgi:hypothetical protein
MRVCHIVICGLPRSTIFFNEEEEEEEEEEDEENKIKNKEN